MTPAVEIRPNLPISVNHNAPSDAAVIAEKLERLLEFGSGYSVIAPSVVIRPTLLTLGPSSRNHNAPSGPVVSVCKEFGRILKLFGFGSGKYVTEPSVVIRP